MPKRPLKPCGAPACSELVRGKRYCDTHKSLADQAKRQHDQRRGTSAQRGYGYKWQRARAGYLAKHPLCVHCQQEGRVQAATDVDHIVPHKGDMAKFWLPSNWQPLCASHHSRKTATEDGGWGAPLRPGAGQ